MAQVHLWTAIAWRCPICPRRIVLCSNPTNTNYSELGARILEHGMDHRMIVQQWVDQPQGYDTTHIVLESPWESRPEGLAGVDFDFARAVIGQVIEVDA